MRTIDSAFRLLPILNKNLRAKITNNIMPQLVPFYFLNQVTFGFALLLVMLYLFSKYILPKYLELFLTRTFITKL